MKFPIFQKIFEVPVLVPSLLHGGRNRTPFSIPPLFLLISPFTSKALLESYEREGGSAKREGI